MRIGHARLSLELHEMVHRPGPTLLLLHALFGSSEDWGEAPASWPGSVYALDFSGHGRSDRVRGSSYYPETLAADADAALAVIGPAAIAGSGLGAYIALLLAGGRADSVPAALLLPGAGLTGGGAYPDFENDFPDLSTAIAGEPVQHDADPAVRMLEVFVRPPEYARGFAEAARKLVFLENGSQSSHPPWWQAARDSAKAEVIRADLQSALLSLATAAALPHT